MVLNCVNLGVEGIGLILGIEGLLDMGRRVVNIRGEAGCGVIVCEREKKDEKEAARRNL
uniref:cation:dicarboxylate symporter family transporter n=1 Tax=Bacillus sp. WP8 TaxID=756828 RepID=UPI0011A5A429